MLTYADVRQGGAQTMLFTLAPRFSCVRTSSSSNNNNNNNKSKDAGKGLGNNLYLNTSQGEP
jgi:hypothetical protein